MNNPLIGWLIAGSIIGFGLIYHCWNWLHDATSTPSEKPDESTDHEHKH